MQTLLRIDSSIFGDDSGSSRLTGAYARAWQQRHPGGRVIHRDLGAEPVGHLEADTFRAFSVAAEERSPAQAQRVATSDELIAELQSADELVIGAPMYNFSVSSQLKAWIDHVARAGVTFRYTAEGPEGLLRARRATVVTTRGGRYAGTPADHQAPYLRQVLGFLGIDEVEFVYAEGTASGSESLDAAAETVRRLAA